jgi:hypothetical protein
MRFPLDPSVEKARCGAYRRQPQTQLEKAHFKPLKKMTLSERAEIGLFASPQVVTP